METEKKLDWFNDFARMYVEKREEHIKSWLDTSSVRKRLSGSAVEYNILMESDFQFDRKMRKCFAERSRENDVTESDMNDIHLYLKNHSERISHRNTFLVISGAMLALVLAAPKTSSFTPLLIGVFLVIVVFMILALMERSALEKRKSITSELENLVESEIAFIKSPDA